MTEINGNRYISYKGFITGLGSVIVIILTIIGLYLTFAPAKVNQELYNRDFGNVCADLAKIQRSVEDNGKMVDVIKRNQELVLRALKIDPVK